ncbi:hypothetical protein ACB496_12820 [Lelliottia nimipressuralis]|uniref:hypothetical protein n=1 Tax=Lelliottia nimipressuralis TaxID=69220 RepID=UPI003556297D
MKKLCTALLMLISLSGVASESIPLVCLPQNPDDQSATGIWPSPFLSGDKVCFDISTDSGNSCVGNGKTTKWFSSAVIIDIDGENQGRDDTWFRVVKPTITGERIEYTIEATRDNKKWGVVSHVTINRLSGQAVDWFIGEHGGTTYQCHVEKKKI